MLRRSLTFIACTLFLAACGGGGGGNAGGTLPQPAPSPPEPAFSVTTTTPADNATAIARHTAFDAGFNRAVAPASVSSTSARLVGPEGNVIPVDIQVNGSDITLTPPLGLPGNTPYRVELAGSIGDAKGATLGSAVSRRFTTVAQSWQPAASVAGSLTDVSGGTAPLVRADRDGNVTAVWKSSPSRIDTLYAARLDAKTGVWGAPVKLAVADELGAFGGVTMTTGASGTAYVAWTDYQSSRQTPRLQRYDPASGHWTELPAIPAAANGYIDSLITADDGTLTAIVRAFGIYATSFDAVAGNWTTPVRIDSPDQPANYAFDLATGADAKGNVFAAFVYGTAEGRIMAVARNSGGHWSVLQRLDDSVLTGLFRTFSLAVSPGGNAVISWTHNYGMAQQSVVMASTYQAGSDAWSPAVRLDQGNPVLGASHPSAVVDAAGIATTLWLQSEGLFASRYNATTGSWSTPQRVGDDNGSVDAVVDIAGNVTAVSGQMQSTHAFQYFVADGQWRDSKIGQPAADSVEGVQPPVVTIDAGGTVTAAWFATTKVGGAWQYGVAVNRFK